MNVTVATIIALCKYDVKVVKGRHYHNHNVVKHQVDYIIRTYCMSLAVVNRLKKTCTSTVL